MPAVSWLRHDMGNFVRETLLAGDSACRNFFEPQAIEEIVGLQEKGKFSGYQEVWSLLVFESWHRQFMESVETPHVASELLGQYVG